MERVLRISDRVLLTLWVGGLWVVGYLVVPSLFATLDDRRLAGELAGNIFRLMNLVGIACALGLLLSLAMQLKQRALRYWRTWAYALMLLLVLVAAFVIQPQMQELKQAGLVPGSEASGQFGRLHGVSSVMYLINSLLGLFVVSAKRQRPAQLESAA
jgi:cell division protein FtsW (lipid II flippase)